MNWENEFKIKNEKPLDRIVEGYSYTSIFRTMAFIGDSLSSGEFESYDSDGNRTLRDMYDYSWGQYIARKNGITAYNFSQGGMTAKKYIEEFAQTHGYWDKNKACQAYVIALGVNDLTQKQPLGNINDVDLKDYKNNNETIIGYYAAIISRYKEIQPDAKFFLVTFPNLEGEEENQKAKDHTNAMHNLSEIFDNTYVIDLYKYGPVYDEKFKKRFFLNGHMSASGYVITAQIIDSYIDYIIRHNPDEFKNVPFIGTNIKFGLKKEV